jgi:hypothetical protein
VLYYGLVYFISEYGLYYQTLNTGNPLKCVTTNQYDGLPVLTTKIKTAVHELGTEEKRLRCRGK